MKKHFIAVAILLILSACASAKPKPSDYAVMVQGKMVSLMDGNEIALEFENTGIPRNGRIMTALNKKTGETFKGNYIINRQGNDSTSVVKNSLGFKTGTVETSSSVDFVLKGILTGNKGTIIPVIISTGGQRININLKDIEFDKVVKFDIYQNAYGEASDNNGTKYQIFLSGNAVKRRAVGLQ